MFPSDEFLGALRNGTNHVSMNLGSFDRVAGPQRGTNYPIYTDALLDWYQVKNIRSVRLMFTWEAVQSQLGASVPSGPAGSGYDHYWRDLIDVLTRLRARGISVILCPWQFKPRLRRHRYHLRRGELHHRGLRHLLGRFAMAVNGVTDADQQVASISSTSPTRTPSRATGPGTSDSAPRTGSPTPKPRSPPSGRRARRTPSLSPRWPTPPRRRS